MGKIIDVCCYNGEKDLFDIRYNILKDYVDQFIVVEFDKTFSGEEKDCLWDVMAKYPKVIYFWKKEDSWSKYYDLALSSPNTNYGKGADHWIREFSQKESIKDCLIHLKDDDIVFIGDCDEIWNPEILWNVENLELGSHVIIEDENPSKIELLVYTYYLNNRSNEKFSGTLVAYYKDIKNKCLNHLRSDTPTFGKGGWHFTSLKDGLKRKLEDSYTKETYANDWVMNNLEKNIAENKDFLGRDFTFKVDESEWPQYLKDNREKYLHLLK